MPESRISDLVSVDGEKGVAGDVVDSEAMGLWVWVRNDWRLVADCGRRGVTS
jgi:hypothetical protein